MAKKYKYICKHCMKVHDSKEMAEICFDLDMKILEHGGPLPERKLTPISKIREIAKKLFLFLNY